MTMRVKDDDNDEERGRKNNKQDARFCLQPTRVYAPPPLTVVSVVTKMIRPGCRL